MSDFIIHTRYCAQIFLLYIYIYMSIVPTNQTEYTLWCNKREWDFTKAGQLVGLAYCYAVIVLADNATFSLAVNRIVAFCTQAANRPHA